MRVDSKLVAIVTVVLCLVGDTQAARPPLEAQATHSHAPAAGLPPSSQASEARTTLPQAPRPSRPAHSWDLNELPKPSREEEEVQSAAPPAWHQYWPGSKSDLRRHIPETPEEFQALLQPLNMRSTLVKIGKRTELTLEGIPGAPSEARDEFFKGASPTVAGIARTLMPNLRMNKSRAAEVRRLVHGVLLERHDDENMRNAVRDLMQSRAERINEYHKAINRTPQYQERRKLRYNRWLATQPNALSMRREASLRFYHRKVKPARLAEKERGGLANAGEGPSDGRDSMPHGAAWSDPSSSSSSAASSS